MTEWGEGIGETPPVTTLDELCNFPWFAITVDWDNKLYPCCDHVVWTDASFIAEYSESPQFVADQWNGTYMRNFRRLHKNNGRSAIPICENCQRNGLAFKE